MRHLLLVASLGLSVPSISARAADSGPCAELQGPVHLENSSTDDRREFCKFAKQAVAGGCCQSTLYECLKKKPSCARGVVLGQVGLGVLATGETEEKAMAAAAAYEDNYAPEKRNVIGTSKVPCKGPSNAPLTLIEFSDFDCPHCAAAAPLVKKLVDANKDVQFCSYVFPLAGHPFSSLAAAAAMYADSKGKFWPMAEALFAGQEERSTVEDEATYRRLILKAGTSVGLDAKGLGDAMHEKTPPMDRVRDQQMAAIGLLIQGTPTFYLNGRSLADLPLGSFDAVLKDERDSKGKK